MPVEFACDHLGARCAVAPGAGPGPPPRPALLPGPIIRHNLVFDVNIGIWMLGVDPASSEIIHNRFGSDVTTPVSIN